MEREKLRIMCVTKRKNRWIAKRDRGKNTQGRNKDEG